ncbi:hypothetical protein [Pseudoduganella violacea]|uniref:Uncharacterized protein n=1 Tax=Pseudoduganella violacea TaxID=1715466 RepID=A0A7W5FTW3_9BURK|nr:hypothetical protein [Pseudoduganella violacea]MBB3119077.1 hypothetical protein [Pseudoduganella violacea]
MAGEIDHVLNHSGRVSAWWARKPYLSYFSIILTLISSNVSLYRTLVPLERHAIDKTLQLAGAERGPVFVLRRGNDEVGVGAAAAQGAAGEAASVGS